MGGDGFGSVRSRIAPDPALRGDTPGQQRINGSAVFVGWQSHFIPLRSPLADNLFWVTICRESEGAL